jgi:hypothetical protein
VQVRFENLEHAKKAAATLHGLKFDGRPVATSFIMTEIYDAIESRLNAQK